MTTRPAAFFALFLFAVLALAGCAVQSAVSGDHLARLLVEDVHRSDAAADSLQVRVRQLEAGIQQAGQIVGQHRQALRAYEVADSLREAGTP